MRKIKSFGNRLIRRVLLTVFAIMMVTLVVTLYAGQRAVGAETRGRYLGIMNVVNEKLGRILKVQEIGTMNVVDEVEHNLKSPETVIAAMEKKMGMSNNVKGYFTAFEPDYYPQKGTWFEPYVYKQKNGEIAIKELGTASHDYHPNGISAQRRKMSASGPIPIISSPIRERKGPIPPSSCHSMTKTVASSASVEPTCRSTG